MGESAWPEDWDDLKAGLGCAMCAMRGAEDNGYGLRVLHGRYADVYLNRAVLRGYAVAIWNGSHVCEPTQLSRDQASGFFAELLSVGRAVEDHFRPVKMNYEVLGNSLPHLHTHVIPRYRVDPAPGEPLPSALLQRDHSEEKQFNIDVAALRDLLGYEPMLQRRV